MTEVRVWAPRARSVVLRLLDSADRAPSDSAADSPAADGRDYPMAARADGWFVVQAPMEPGRDYGFLLDGADDLLPDPRTRWQPYGVHGPSRWHDPGAYRWSDDRWTGRVLAGAVIYELHIGTFSDEGTFDAAIQQLEHLVQLGITHVEVLPVNAFNGEWNWGYDGVDWYAVQHTYGGPDGFLRFVDACHARGLAVILDVVYNHLGPSGNYLPKFGPYLKQGRSTWGDLINLDGAQSGPVRRHILDNALMWLTDFHVDGLRIDAVHALIDASPTHLLEQLAAEVDAASAGAGRPLTLIAESDLNDPVMITAREAGGYGLDAQWDDDVHHCLHALLTGERQGYYADFGAIGALAKVLRGAFYHDGTYSSFRGRMHGRPVDRERIAGYRFVAFLQDHDQVGNRATGDRLPAIADPQLLRVGAMLLLASPFTPMLWMGEEWAASTPWRFFTSHPEPELAEATAAGRIAEFTEHGWDPQRVPDPQDPETFRVSKLRWSELGEPAHAESLELYRALIALRRAHPQLADPRLDRIEVDFDEDARWLVVHRGDLRVAANLGDEPQDVPLSARAAALLLGTQPGCQIADGGRAVTLPARSGAVLRLAAASAPPS